MKTKVPFEYNALVKPIILPKPFEEFIGDAVLSGWGSIEGGGNTFPDALQMTVLPVISDEGKYLFFFKFFF